MASKFTVAANSGRSPSSKHSGKHSASDAYDRKKMERAHSSQRMEFLAELDDELDYNEDDPSSQEVTTSAKSRALNQESPRGYRSTMHSRGRLPSPREEGEEYSEDDDDYSSHVERRREHTEKTHMHAEREEGEASSEDERRYHQSGERKERSHKSKRQGGGDPAGLSLEEAQYRNRIHERFERREMEYSKRLKSQQNPLQLVEQTSPIHSGSTKSRSQAESKSTADFPVWGDANSKHSGDPYEKRAQQKQSTFSSPRELDSAQYAGSQQIVNSKVDVTGGRSYSASMLSYEHTTEAEMQYRGEIKRSHKSSSRKAKSKKSKRNRPEKEREYDERKHQKSHPSTEVSYQEWGERTVSQYDISLPPGRRDTEPPSRDSSGSSQNHSRSSRSSSSNRMARESSSQRPYIDNEKYSKRKHKHRYRREARETAPPPESLLSSYTGDITVGGVKHRSHRSEKHKIKDIDEPFPYPVKQSRRSRDLENEGPSEQGRVRNTASEPMEHEFYGSETEQSSRPSSQKDELQPSGQTRGRHTKTRSRSPFREEGGSDSSAASASATADQAAAAVAGTGGDHLVSQKPSSAKPSPNTKSELKRDLEAMRSQRYNLYSETDDSEDEEDDDNVATEVNQVEKEETKEDEKPQTPSKPFYFPSIQGCRSVEEFECLNRIEEGTYGVVYRARDKKTAEIVALKRLKMEKERDGFPITSLREINTLMKAQHENIVTVREIVVGSNMDKIYLVMDYVEHDLKSLMEVMNGPFSVGEVKCLMVQLLRAVRHLHDNWILHRDLKTSNLLLSHQGILKVGDFGLAREYGSPLKHYTEVVVTLWYRAPELLLGTKQYTCPIDLWSVGCIFAEFLLQRPLFPGKGEMDELNIIFRDLGTPTERIWPGVSHLPGMKKCAFTDYPYNQLRRRFTEKQISDQGFDLLNSFLTYCPDRRITAEKALTHAYFNERPRAIHPSMFPSWPAKSEGGVAVRKASPRPPAGGGALAAAAAALAAAAAAASGTGARVHYQPPAPPMGGQRFYSSMADSRPGTTIGSDNLISSGPDKGFLLRF
ncbi:unnamed protein product [Calicophoron daubneyi]